MSVKLHRLAADISLLDYVDFSMTTLSGPGKNLEGVLAKTDQYIPHL